MREAYLGPSSSFQWAPLAFGLQAVPSFFFGAWESECGFYLVLVAMRKSAYATQSAPQSATENCLKSPKSSSQCDLCPLFPALFLFPLRLRSIMGNSSSTSSTISRSVRAFTSLLDSGDDGSMGAQNRDDATPSGAAMEDDPHVTPKVASARVAVGEDQDFAAGSEESQKYDDGAPRRLNAS